MYRVLILDGDVWVLGNVFDDFDNAVIAAENRAKGAYMVSVRGMYQGEVARWVRGIRV